MIRGAAILCGFTLATVGWSYEFTVNLTTRLPIKWPAGPVAVQIKADATVVLPGDGSTRATSIQTATQLWNTYLGAVQFQSQLLAPGSAEYANGVTEIAFANTMFGQAFDTRTLAVTFIRSRGNEATERDVLFNATHSWDSYRGSFSAQGGAYDIQRVAIHELGHVLGLDHPDEATPAQSVTAIMNSTISDVFAPVADDIAGAQTLYGPPGVPANNHFAQAADLVMSNQTARATGYNTNASREPGEPLHAANAGGRSIWWKWTAPASGTVSLNTQGSIFDTTLGVYQGTSLASLTTIAASDDLQDGVIQYSTLSFPAIGGTTYHVAVDGFDGDSGYLVLNLAFAPNPASAPVILTAPANQTVPLGSSVAFFVTATGAPAPSYQWLKDGVALPGATGASLAIGSVQPADAGSYTAIATNSLGSATSGAAVLTVVDARATQAVVGAGYTAGGTVTIAQTLTYAGICTGLDWQILLPVGWSYASSVGTGGSVQPAAGTTSLLEWTWTTVPASPLNFTVTLNVPADQAGARTLTSLVVFRVAAGLINLLVKPDPLRVTPAGAYSADTDWDFRLSLLELTRVIELYNTRNGTQRTGCYKVETGTEDGFAPEPTRAGTATVTLATYHSTDSDRNGRLSLLELTRVIELYNTHNGTTRTGAYHAQAGTEDGFAPGP